MFAGFDNEETPTLGGIYLAPLPPNPTGTTQSHHAGQHRRARPRGGRNSTFNGLGEGGAFDGRYVGFWGAWGSETGPCACTARRKATRTASPTAIRSLVCEDTRRDDGRPEQRLRRRRAATRRSRSRCSQGIFVHDTEKGTTRTVAKTGARLRRVPVLELLRQDPLRGRRPRRGRRRGRRRAGALALVRRSSRSRRGPLPRRLQGRTDRDGSYPVDGIYLRPAARARTS